METFLMTIIPVLLAAVLGGIGYILQRIYEKIETLTGKTEAMSRDISEMKPKVNLLWSKLAR
jgi:hypothetical protein